MSSLRSSTGCLACKKKRKKCDETKPHCRRCQRSRAECPGYTYIQDPNNPKGKLRTIPAPRTVASRERAVAHHETTLTNNKELHLHSQGHSHLDDNLPTFDASYGVQGTPGPVVAYPGTSSEAIDLSNGCLFTYSSANPPAPTPSSIIGFAPLTSGQASLLEALLSLGQPPPLDPPTPHTQPRTHLLPDPSALTVKARPRLDTEQQDNVTTHNGQDLDSVFNLRCRSPVLDKIAKTNALPFVLQSYATWVSQVTFEPSKMARIGRDLVCGHFGDGDQSRWIMALVANIGGRVRSVQFIEGRSNPMLSVLQNAVLWQLGTVMSRRDSKRPTLITALDSALEASNPTLQADQPKPY
ncbi:unnamed protein product [Rhizoctonia solani]|uniref:Zn(2)-C6 fungal-type domain-containing protein n=1 Tax=Rhizoctonia solani TaxID=456999 RepID=A0A8H3GZ47_9AGAM|nr:unnamed protein product [Rhizoctonia solani]